MGGRIINPGTFTQGLIQDQPSIYDKISANLNYSLPDLVRDIVGLSNSQKILYHGFQRKDFDKIKEQGVKPLTVAFGQLD